MARKKVARLTVTQTRSAIGRNKSQSIVLRSLGLRRIRHSVEVEDTEAVRGMLLKVRHLVEVQE